VSGRSLLFCCSCAISQLVTNISLFSICADSVTTLTRRDLYQQSSACSPFDAHYCCHMGTAIKDPVPHQVKASFVIFDIRALSHSAMSVTVPGCQKITNDGLTRSGTECFIAVPIWQQQCTSRVKLKRHLWIVDIRYSIYEYSTLASASCWLVNQWNGCCHLMAYRFKCLLSQWISLYIIDGVQSVRFQPAVLANAVIGYFFTSNIGWPTKPYM